MGLFWSLKVPSQNSIFRLVKKDVDRPMEFKIQVFDGDLTADQVKPGSEIARQTIYRTFMAPNVKRIPLKEGKIKGTVFIPEGTC